MKTTSISLQISAEPWRLIRNEARRTGKTWRKVVADLLELLPPPEHADEVIDEFVFDADDPYFESRIIELLALKHLKVN